MTKTAFVLGATGRLCRLNEERSAFAQPAVGAAYLGASAAIERASRFAPCFIVRPRYRGTAVL